MPNHKHKFRLDFANDFVYVFKCEHHCLANMYWISRRLFWKGKLK